MSKTHLSKEEFQHLLLEYAAKVMVDNFQEIVDKLSQRTIKDFAIVSACIKTFVALNVRTKLKLCECDDHIHHIKNAHEDIQRFMSLNIDEKNFDAREEYIWAYKMVKDLMSQRCYEATEEEFEKHINEMVKEVEREKNSEGDA